MNTSWVVSGCFISYVYRRQLRTVRVRRMFGFKNNSTTDEQKTPVLSPHGEQGCRQILTLVKLSRPTAGRQYKIKTAVRNYLHKEHWSFMKYFYFTDQNGITKNRFLNMSWHFRNLAITCSFGDDKLPLDVIMWDGLLSCKKKQRNSLTAASRRT